MFDRSGNKERDLRRGGRDLARSIQAEERLNMLREDILRAFIEAQRTGKPVRFVDSRRDIYTPSEMRAADLAMQGFDPSKRDMVETFKMMARAQAREEQARRAAALRS